MFLKTSISRRATFRTDLFSALSLYEDRASITERFNVQQSNEELRHLVNYGRFFAAERKRLKLVSNGLDIEPNADYARAALRFLRQRKLGPVPDEYLAWLELIPDRDCLSPDAKSPFKNIVKELTVKSTSYLAEVSWLSRTGLMLANKGYAREHFVSLARPIILRSTAMSTPVAHLTSMEVAAGTYEEYHDRPSTPITSYIRSALVELFIQRGWTGKALHFLLMERKRKFVLPHRTYKMVLNEIIGTDYAEFRGAVLERWRMDQEIALEAREDTISDDTPL